MALKIRFLAFENQIPYLTASVRNPGSGLSTLNKCRFNTLNPQLRAITSERKAVQLTKVRTGFYDPVFEIEVPTSSVDP